MHASGPFTPTFPLGIGAPINIRNPAQGSGNLVSANAVVANLTPYELEVSSGSGLIVGLIDPYTRDVVPLDQDAGQQITVTPVNIGFGLPIGVNPLYYVLWYGPNETIPAALPAPINSGGSVTIAGQPIEVAAGPVSVGGLTAYVTDISSAGSLTLVPAPGIGAATRLWSAWMNYQAGDPTGYFGGDIILGNIVLGCGVGNSVAMGLGPYGFVGPPNSPVTLYLPSTSGGYHLRGGVIADTVFI